MSLKDLWDIAGGIISIGLVVFILSQLFSVSYLQAPRWLTAGTTLVLLLLIVAVGVALGGNPLDNW
jgi:CDP-diglyceride synthetase